MGIKNLKVWTCKIIVDADDLPPGFDSPPRMAAEDAIEEAGFKVLMNSSGWGGELDESDIQYLKQNGYKRGSDVYYAGLMDAPEDVSH